MRELGDPTKVRAVRSFIQSNRVGFCSLLETKVREDRFGIVFGSFGGDWRCVSS